MSASSSPGDPDNGDPVIVVLTADTATVAETRARALAERAAKRQAIAARKRFQSQDRQKFGVTLMKIKNYEGAVACFADACVLWRANAVCHCDLATAYLHLGRFEDAEAAAGTALALDPKLVEARYARGMARKARGIMRGAIADFSTVLKLAPDNVAAQTALHELHALSPPDAASLEGEAPGPEDAEAAAYAAPSPSATRLELEASGSDTSDANHRASGVPCLFYNHQGCARGSTCKFSHAPDEKSVRDDIGKNVCLHFLLGACKFGPKCIYAHSRTYLSTDPARWWNDDAQIAEIKARVEEARVRRKREVEERGKGGGGGRRKKGKGKRRAGGQAQGEGQNGSGMEREREMAQLQQQQHEEMERRMTALGLGFADASRGFTDYDLNAPASALARAPLPQGPDADAQVALPY